MPQNFLKLAQTPKQAEQFFDLQFIDHGYHCHSFKKFPINGRLPLIVDWTWPYLGYLQKVIPQTSQPWREAATISDIFQDSTKSCKDLHETCEELGGRNFLNANCLYKMDRYERASSKCLGGQTVESMDRTGVRPQHDHSQVWII